MLAGRALDEDGNLTLQTGVASNGFGLIGLIVGIAVGDRNLAAGLGYYAAAPSVYDNFIQPGRNVVFPKTRVSRSKPRRCVRQSSNRKANNPAPEHQQAAQR